MHCPSCTATETKVIDSRLLLEGQTVRRRRKCDGCGSRFTTYEKCQIQLPMVVKNDGRRENFNRDKIKKGLEKASQKRPVSTCEIEKLIDEVEKSLIEISKSEVSASDVGEIVMLKLHELDPVAYVRFASFYWDFKDIDGFVDSLQTNLKITSTKRSIQRATCEGHIQ